MNINEIAAMKINELDEYLGTLNADQLFVLADEYKSASKELKKTKIGSPELAGNYKIARKFDSMCSIIIGRAYSA